MREIRFGRSLWLLCALALLSPSFGASAAANCAATATGGDWPRFGGDYANTRSQPNEHAITPDAARTLAPLWRFSVAGSGGAGDFNSTPIVAGGCVYAGTYQGWVFALNADDGSLVWKIHLDRGGAINSSVASDQGKIFVFASRKNAPYVVALDARDGHEVWYAQVDSQAGADAFGSPVAWNGLVFVGISGDTAKHASQDVRYAFHGSFVLLDEATGALIVQTPTVTPSEQALGYAGASIPATPAIDTDSGYAYVGTAGSFRPPYDPMYARSILKIDLERTRSTFGQIVAHYKGDSLDDFVPGYNELPCAPIPLPPPPPIVPTGRGVGPCGDSDLDFSASPTLFQSNGKLLVGEAQKSGAFHVADTESMARVWRTTWGVFQPFGGASSAYDGTSLFSAGTPPGYVFGLSKMNGSIEWVGPTADLAHYGLPVSEANGVVYTMDLTGCLDAFDATTGLPLLHRPVILGASVGSDPGLSFGAVSIARNTVYVSTGIESTGADAANALNGSIIALRPSLTVPDVF
ncbi:MAG: outer membrane protein assembly factor BamB family protein [Actinomycetota bacterium]